MNDTYNSKAVGRDKIYVPGVNVALKLYFLDILNRTPRSDYEWSESGLQKEHVVEKLKKHPDFNREVVGIVTLFPHITSLYAFFGNEGSEWNFYRRAYKTSDLSRVVLGQDGFFEVGSLGEMEILSAEGRHWADSPTIEAYMKHDFPMAGNVNVQNPRKLKEWLERAK